ncbi:MAG: bifunctional 3'-5' exonuclease/DNA polymerase [Actinomycetota bacterium]|nr:bifunctional 3'-5' exonuclease/DNA polymerase [Actinomycetota bacterium]
MYLLLAAASDAASATSAGAAAGFGAGSESRPPPGAATTAAAADVPSVDILHLGADGSPSQAKVRVALRDLPAVVRSYEAKGRPRWVWHRTQEWYPQLLAVGVSVERCHDLSLCRNILVFSEFTAHTDYARDTRARPVEVGFEPRPEVPNQDSLFDQPVRQGGPGPAELQVDFRLQLQAVRGSTEPARLNLLLAAESAGALIAAEMQQAGLPWREDLHQQILHDHLGPRPSGLQRPEKLEILARELRDQLNAPALNPDSPQELMRALHRAGIEVKTTRSWELQQITHPAIAPLLAYKKLSRLHAANGWTWLDQWVKDGRFRPEYVVGGVVSGRWASRGGGALQIPRQIRAAAYADPGHKLIVADAAQLEPRVLAALAQDSGMAEAARDKDLYAGIAAQGFGGDRAKAKVALLGAIYGATTGESGRLMPQLARTYPRAVGFVEEAARAGEKGAVVTTRLGRSCPPPSERWLAAQRSTTAEEQRWADNVARSRGRFTRNFVVQGSAADWASCWLAELRRRLRALPGPRRNNLGPDDPAGPAPAGGAAELVLFLHDEVMVHAPDESVEAVRQLVEDSARAATRLLFGQIPIEIPVNITVVDSYADAK